MDSQIDRLQQQVVEKLHRTLGSQEHSQHQSLSQQITDIQIAALSLPKPSKDVLPPFRLADLISNVSRTLPKSHDKPHDISAAYQSDLVWLITAKAAVRTLGLVLINLVEETHILSDEILYWDDILVSPWYIGFHVAQTTPFYIWDGAKNIFKEMNHDIQGQQSSSMTTRWTQFYDLIRQRVYMQPVSSVRTRISSHFALCKSEIRQKQKVLKTMKDLYASSVGLLMKDCLSFDFDENLPSTNGHQPVGSQWRDALTKNIILMEAILHNIADHSHVADFERSVSTTLRAEEHSVRNQFDERMMFENPSLLHERLVQILKELVPKHVAFSRAASQKYGHPPWIVRYWLPISFLLLSTSTSLRVLANKRTEILQWVMDIGSTAVDFWGNWVVEPIQRLIGTIRHDKDSEIAIMSKNSLEADRASLERMVVDFVQDRPLATHNEAAPIDAQTITASVKEGDLTPVLKAYERDLRSPFVGTVRGDLIRALLIQIQKTKVDVEVAISGIDSLLKSQELVFGYALTFVVCELDGV